MIVDGFGVDLPAVAPGREAPILQQQQLTSLGFPRDTFWPKSAAAFVIVGLLLTVASAQLVSPTRRLRLWRPSLGRPAFRRRTAVAAASDQPADPAAAQSPEPLEPPEQSTETIA